MSRRVTLVTLALVAVVAFLVGAIVAGGVGRPAVSAGATPVAAVRPVAARASLRALIVASVPELTSRSISIDGIAAMTISASSTSPIVGAPNEKPRVAAFLTASTT